MATNQIIQLAGTLDIPGMTKLDVTPDEIVIANLESLKLWAATAPWGVHSDGLGFIHRVTRVKIPLNGASVASRLANAFDGQPALSLGTSSSVIKDSTFNTSGSFTVAFTLCPLNDDLAAVGASSAELAGAGQSYWFIASSGGKFRIGTTSLSTQFADYVGPLLSKTAWLRLILRFDRAAGTMTLYVNGVQQAKITNDAIKTLNLAPGVVFGGLVTGSSTPASAPCLMRSPMAFNTAISDAELALVDKYLSATYY
ncbi:LamG-like jellyroll fold domain-containing protein [Pseudomonas sp. GTC 16473]|uniref:LamG-like jellyroll fold domain-containing protein n=1 Tax=Pseudomonas sp. GTC 16473 TaxID=1661060 RepID=UPI0008636373|nr:LamG-like jellyroll fold domain-containing protein [Pseudomonas sp. GTC 16473]